MNKVTTLFQNRPIMSDQTKSSTDYTQKTFESDYYFFHIQISFSKREFDEKTVKTAIQTILSRMYGQLGTFSFEILSFDKFGVKISVLRKNAVQFRAALTFNLFNKDVGIEQVSVIKASPYLHSLSKDSKDFFTKHMEK
jgi:hypothetical protein